MTQTVAADTTRAYDALVSLLSGENVLVLSGAGISTGSGIPDYRGPNGQHRVDKPITLPEFLASTRVQQTYWARSHIGWERFRAATPNAAHEAVAALEMAGVVQTVVTQNVDGLHQAAGSRNVVELHGRLDTVICLHCRVVSDREEYAVRLRAANPTFHAHAINDTLRPDGDVLLDEALVATFRTVACGTCGGVMKPNVVMFGEHIPGSRFGDALTTLTTANALVVLGSSLTVGSGYRFVLDAKRQGVPVAIVTRGMTRADSHADVKIDTNLCLLLPRIAETIASTPKRPSVT